MSTYLLLLNLCDGTNLIVVIKTAIFLKQNTI